MVSAMVLSDNQNHDFDHPDRPDWQHAAPHLGDDETLIWTGRPALRLMVRRNMTPVRVGFGLTILGIAIALAWAQMSNGHSIGIFTICVGLFGLWRATTPFRWAFQSRGVLYAITDNRLFMVKPPPWTRVVNYFPGDIEFVHLKERNAEYGSVVFDQRKVVEGAPFRLDDTPLDLGFLEITRARRAERAILDLLKTQPRRRE